MKTIFLDTETTGFSAEHDDVLEIAIIDEKGRVLLETLVRPVKKTEWLEAQAVNGITPEMVAYSPTLEELAPQIAAAFKDAQVVMYNAEFDYEFLKPCLGDMVEGTDFYVHCAMRRFSVARGVWDGREGKNNYKRWRQIEAAAHVGHMWIGDAHRALADAQACRSVWQWSLPMMIAARDFISLHPEAVVVEKHVKLEKAARNLFDDLKLRARLHGDVDEDGCVTLDCGNGVLHALLDALGDVSDLKGRPEIVGELLQLRSQAVAAEDAQTRLRELELLVNTPHTKHFLESVRFEVAHQVKRWGTVHDRAKEPQDWFWLLGYLGGKALKAHAEGNHEKALHHTISSAAVLANWHAAISLADNKMQPGSSDLQAFIEKTFGTLPEG